LAARAYLSRHARLANSCFAGDDHGLPTARPSSFEDPDQRRKLIGAADQSRRDEPRFDPLPLTSAPDHMLDPRRNLAAQLLHVVAAPQSAVVVSLISAYASGGSGMVVGASDTDVGALRSVGRGGRPSRHRASPMMALRPTNSR
jgi:hypothetical protein